jgi:hypothetical protein
MAYYQQQRSSGRLQTIRVHQLYVLSLLSLADLGQERAAKDFPFDCQAAALVVVQSEAALAEFLAEHLVIGSEVINGLLLLAVDPASEDEMEQLPRLKDEIHGGPVVVEKDALASGPGPALSMSRKLVHRCASRARWASFPPPNARNAAPSGATSMRWSSASTTSSNPKSRSCHS